MILKNINTSKRKGRRIKEEEKDERIHNGAKKRQNYT